MLKLIQQKIQAHSQELENQINEQLDSAQFSLYEDLLILEKMLTEKLNFNHFVDISRKCYKKSPDDLKLRYISCLKYLQEKDLALINDFLKENNLYAALIYDKNGIKIERITFNSKKQKKQNTESKVQNQSLKKNENNDSLLQQIKIEPKIKKKVRVQPQNQPQPVNYYQLTDLQKHLIYQYTQQYQELRFPTNPDCSQLNRMRQEEFQNALHDLSLWYEIPQQKLMILLQACSGSFNNLRQFLEDKNFLIYWKPEEDEKLKTGNESQLYLSKGFTEVQRRKQWLQLD